MPVMLFLLLGDPVGAGRVLGTGGTGGTCWSLTWRLRAGSEWAAMEGGVNEPVVGVPVSWLPCSSLLEVSVERSVLKLAMDRLRSSLKLRKDGAIMALMGCGGLVPMVGFGGT